MREQKEQRVLNKKENCCNICNKIIVGSSYKFKAHLYQHNVVQARFKCSYCSKGFYRKDTYEIHVNGHKGKVSEKKLHICDYCERGFVNKRNLILHLKVHDDTLYLHRDLGYRCIACGVSYVEKRLLKYHIRKNHYNLDQLEKDKTNPHHKKTVNESWVENVNNTQLCAQMTKLNSNVISIKKVCIKNEFKSEMCDINAVNLEKRAERERFQEYIKSSFAAEDRTHYSKAICDYCNKEMLKKSLRSHIKERHLKIKQFKCEECNASYSRHYQLVGHVCEKYRTNRRRRIKNEQLEKNR